MRRPISSASSGGLGIRHGGPAAQGRRGGGRARGHRAQQGQGRPPAHALAEASAALIVLDRLAGEGQHAVEEALVFRRELVGRLRVRAFGKRRVGVEVVADVAAPALDEMLSEPATVRLAIRAAQVVRQLGELGLEQGEQRTECLFLAAVRRRRDQDQVAILVGGQPLQELVAQVPAAPSFRPGMRRCGPRRR